MGFLERARSTRGRHHRGKSSKSNEPTPQTSPSQLKRSATRSKRKSIFPGLSGSNTVTTTCEGTRSRSASVNQSAHASKVDGNSTPQELPLATPFNMHYKSGNESFRFPSPALVNNGPRGSPLTSIAHLPSIVDDHSSPLAAAPQNQSRKAPPNWGRSATDPIMSTTARKAAPTQAATWDCEGDARQSPQIKKQKSAWKTLGSLFKGKQARQPIPDQFYQIQPPSDDALASTHRKQGKVGVLDSPLPSPSPPDDYATKRVDSGRTIREPSGQNGTDNLLTPTPANLHHRKSENFSHQTQAPANTMGNTPRTPKLDISIPDAGFDRYSVMFEKLLEPKVSLIERRQSKRMNVESSKANDSTSNAESLRSATSLQRSMTSPSLSRIPSLSVYIANSNRADKTKDTYQGPIAHRPRPPKRSRTAPSQAHSPVVPATTFNSTTPVTAKAIPLPKRRNAPTTKTTASSPTSPCSYVSENSLPPTPTTATSLASSIDTTIFGPSPPKARTASAAASSSSLPPPPPPIPTRSAERLAGPHAFNRQIVQVSVARQVSVSKARRRVADAVEVKQPLRPRVVELGKNRKSTLVLIEGGD